MISYYPIVTGSLTINGDLIVTGTGSMSSSAAISSSYAYSASSAVSSYTASSAINASASLVSISSSYAQTASYANTFTVGSTLTAQTLVVQTITSSIDYITGSARFGSSLGNTQTFTGSVNITGSQHSIFGNVGIGTTSPTSILHISSSVPNLILQSNSASVASTSAQISFRSLMSNGTTNYIATIEGVQQNTAQNSGDLTFHNYNNGNWNETMRLTSGSYVGIGTTTPSYPLDVNGVVRSIGSLISTNNSAGVPSPSSSLWMTDSNSNSNWQLYIGGLTNSFSGSLGILQNGGAKVIIQSGSGYVGIGTTTPTYAMTIVAGSGSGANRIQLVPGGDYGFFQLNPTPGTVYIGTDNSTGGVFGQGAYSMNIYNSYAGNMNFYTNGNLAMKIISGSGNILMGGITADTGQKLQVLGAAQFGDAASMATFNGSPIKIRTTSTGSIAMTYSSVRTWQMGINSAGSFLITDFDAGVDRLIISSSGNIGIGTTPSGWVSPFTVIQGGTYGQHIGFQSNAADMKVGSNNYYNGSGYVYVVTGQGAAQLNVGATNGFNFSVAPSGTAGATVNFTSSLTITNAGQVNIGNGSYNPTLQFQTGGSTNYNGIISTNSNADYIAINGGSSTGYANGGQITLIGADRYGTSTAGQVTIAAGNASNNTAFGFISFNTANTERMRITSGGNVGIGVNPSYTFHVNGGTYFLRSGNTYTSYTSDGLWGSTATPSFLGSAGNAGSNTKYGVSGMLIGYQDNSNGLYSPAYGFEVKSTDGRPVTGQVVKAIVMKDTDTGTLVFYINNNGNVLNVNNSYGSTSDISIKENITDATPKLNDLLSVKIRNYNLKADPNKTKQIGVVAQELEEVFPGMVETDTEGLKSVKYSVFVPILIKAIQELKATNDSLTTRIQALESK